MVERAKREIHRNTAKLLAVGVALLLVGARLGVATLLGKILVAAGLAVGASAPLASFYLVYRKYVSKLRGASKRS